MTKIIKGLSLTTLLFPIILCIIAQIHHFDFGRIMIDAVLLLTAIVGLRVVFYQQDLKSKDLIFKGRQIINDLWIIIILLGVCILSVFLCIMALMQPTLEVYQIPAFYLLAIFAFRMNHKAVYASKKVLYYDFKEYLLRHLQLLEHRDDGRHSAFHLKEKKDSFWIVLSSREGKKFQQFLKEGLK